MKFNEVTYNDKTNKSFERRVMMIKLMYITNKAEVAKIAEHAGVERIFIDMEYIGKTERQGGMDTVQNRHTTEDVRKIRDAVSKSEVLVRINPIHDQTEAYCGSKEEIDAVIDAGADLIMLPYFKTVEEVREFIRMVAGRARTILLLETPEAVEVIDDILAISGIDEIHIGLNDLSLGYGKKFMFELLADGTIEMLCNKIKQRGIPYGFGGIASLGKGLLKGEYVLKEHYRLGSVSAILSRSFCNLSEIENLDTAREIFERGVKEIREYEEMCRGCSVQEFEENKCIVQERVAAICQGIH